jgi:hypothetical protein
MKTMTISRLTEYALVYRDGISINGSDGSHIFRIHLRSRTFPNLVRLLSTRNVENWDNAYLVELLVATGSRLHVSRTDIRWILPYRLIVERDSPTSILAAIRDLSRGYDNSLAMTPNPVHSLDTLMRSTGRKVPEKKSEARMAAIYLKGAYRLEED